MLSKHVVNNVRKRTSRRFITEEGLALKELRLSRGLSMRQLADKVGKSDSYISHIENGRLDFPKGATLDTLLSALGDIKPKSFFERARRCRMRVQQEELIIKWLRQATDEDVQTIFDLVRL